MHRLEVTWSKCWLESLVVSRSNWKWWELSINLISDCRKQSWKALGKLSQGQKLFEPAFRTTVLQYCNKQCVHYAKFIPLKSFDRLSSGANVSKCNRKWKRRWNKHGNMNILFVARIWLLNNFAINCPLRKVSIGIFSQFQCFQCLRLSQTCHTKLIWKLFSQTAGCTLAHVRRNTLPVLVIVFARL